MIFEFDRYAINVDTFEAFRSGERLSVEPQVLDLLIFLIRNRDRAVTKEEVFEVVWKGRLVSDATLSSRIKAVRQLLGDDGSTQRFVRTIRGRGFRFVHDVRADDSDRSNESPRTSSPLTTCPPPETLYAKSGDVHVAYHLFGGGSTNLVLVPGFVSHIDNFWDSPPVNRWLTRVGQMARVAMFDKRGTGLSDPVGQLPGMDQRMDDVRAVMDAAQFDKAVIMGVSEGGSLASLFAASHPERCQGLILYGAFAKFTSWFPDEQSLQILFDYIETDWGTGKSIPNFAPSVAGDPEFRQWWGKFERLGATPGNAIALMRMNSEIDISQALPAIQAPTLVLHRRDDVLIDIEGGRFLAQNIPGARLIEYAGKDHLIWVGDKVEEMLGTIEEFVTSVPPEATIEHTLTTLLVAKLHEQAHSAAGRQSQTDHRQRDRMLRHALARYRGVAFELSDDRLVAKFDGPARALKCALAIVGELSRFELPVRIGVHTGELRIARDRPTGLALDIASGIVELAEANDVLASRTVMDLVAGSAIAFEESRDYVHPDFFEPWRVFRIVADGDSDLR